MRSNRRRSESTRVCDECTEKRLCRGCKVAKPESEFTPNEWWLNWTGTTTQNPNVSEMSCSVLVRELQPIRASRLFNDVANARD